MKRILLLIVIVECAVAIQNPKLCGTVETPSLVNLNKACMQKLNSVWKFDELKENENPVILNRLHHDVSGLGYRCYLDVMKISCHESLLGAKTSEHLDWQTVVLSATECWEFVKTKRCFRHFNDHMMDRPLTCDPTGCSTIHVPECEYIYGDTKVLYGYRCGFVNTGILGDTETNRLLTSVPCKVRDFSCNIGTSVMVWNNSILHQCPFEEIRVKGNFARVDNTFLVNNESNVLLKPSKRVKMCKTSLIYTDQGVYLANSSFRSLMPQFDIRTNVDESVIEKLLISNIDYNQLTEVKWLQFIDSEICSLVKTELLLFSNFHERYLVLENSKQQEIILYTKYGLIYFPECFEVENVIFPIKSQKCYQELPIGFSFKGEDMVGFINKDRIIKRHGTEVPCSQPSDVIIMFDSDDPSSFHYFQRILQSTIKRDSNSFKWLNLNLLKNNIYDVNSHHPDAILTGTDDLGTVYNQVKMQGLVKAVVLAKDDSVFSSDQHFKSPISTIKKVYYTWKTYLITGGLIFMTIIIISILIFFCGFKAIGKIILFILKFPFLLCIDIYRKIQRNRLQRDDNENREQELY